MTKLPAGTQVKLTNGRTGTVDGRNIGQVTDTEHANYGRVYQGVELDPVDGDMGCNRYSREFVDELEIIEPEFKAVDFKAVKVGDTVSFVTADNGYGGCGQVWRTGTVTRTTDKTVTVDCGHNKLGRTAVLRRATWHYRSVARASH